MAEVWKAMDPHLQRYVALKILHADLQNDPGFIKRFEREARAVASLRHPNIVQVHDFQISRLAEEESPTVYMAMEYVEGMTLTQYIYNTSYQGNFPPADEIIHLFTSISAAIDYAHQRGMIHRDIKPANILLDKRNPSRYQMGEPILTDFGIVKLLGASTATLSGSWMGTPAYISPEQAQGHPGNERTDIYSLGVILYEICTGVRPFQEDNALAMIWHHINTVPTPPSLVNPYIPEALSAVILRSLAKDPSARFQSASEMADAITRAFMGSTFQSLPYPVNTVSQESYTTPGYPNLPPGLTPPTPFQPTPGSSSAIPPVAITPRFPVSQTPPGNSSSASGQGASTTPMGGIPETSSMANLPQSVAVPAGFLPDTMLPPSYPTSPHQPRKRRLLLLIALLCIVLVSSSLGAFYFLQKGSVPSTPGDQVVGQAVFMSSGQLSVGSSQGLNDQLQIDLHNIQAPAAGKSYYAWLLGADSSTICPPLNVASSIPLGKLTVDHSNVHFRYKNVQHDNLLGSIGSILITEESANAVPTGPSSDTTTWRYSAALPQEPSNQLTNPSSILETIRCLIYDQPNLISQGIHGGIETQYLKNIQQVLNAANSARNALNANDTRAAHRQALAILEYIDGLAVFKQEIPNEPPPSPGDVRAQIALISLQQSFGDYTNRLSSMLTNILTDPGGTPDIDRHATEARQALSNELTWLQQVHTDALQLVHLSADQWQQTAAEDDLNAMLTYAQYAYAGQIDTAAGISKPGAVQIDKDIQSLATFEIKPVANKQT